ncbi:unnamed protein product [Lampetra fluviatilis]
MLGSFLKNSSQHVERDVGAQTEQHAEAKKKMHQRSITGHNIIDFDCWLIREVHAPARQNIAVENHPCCESPALARVWKWKGRESQAKVSERPGPDPSRSHRRSVGPQKPLEKEPSGDRSRGSAMSSSSSGGACFSPTRLR